MINFIVGWIILCIVLAILEKIWEGIKKAGNDFGSRMELKELYQNIEARGLILTQLQREYLENHVDDVHLIDYDLKRGRKLIVAPCSLDELIKKLEAKGIKITDAEREYFIKHRDVFWEVNSQIENNEDIQFGGTRYHFCTDEEVEEIEKEFKDTKVNVKKSKTISDVAAEIEDRSNYWRCKKCGGTNPSHLRYCKSCGEYR